MHVVLADTHPESLQTILERMGRTIFPPDPIPATPITPPLPQAPAVQIAVDVEITTETQAKLAPLAPAILLLPAPRLVAQGITAIVPDPLSVADLVEVLPPLADPAATPDPAEALPAPAYTNGFTRPYKNPDLKLVSQNGNGHRVAVAEATETIRPELNIEKHADFIFAPSHSKNLHKPRNRTWVEVLPDGRKATASIVIEPFRGKTPTTKTRKTYLGLHRILERKGWNDEERTIFSFYELATALGLTWHGKTTLTQLENELFQLRGTLILWTRSFLDENGNATTIKGSFNILDDFRVVVKADRDTKELFLALSSFRFHEAIRKNLKVNRTKPTNIDVALNIKGELAAILYARLDVLLADKEPYAKQERTTERLFFDDLKLDGKDYHKPSVRKRFLEKAVNELNGKPISTGILDLKLAKTADDKDWKLVYRKLPLTDQLPKPVKMRRVPDANPPEAIPSLINDIEAAIGRYPSKERLFTKLLKTYPADLVYQAISEYRADTRDLPPEKHVREPIAYFQGILHKIAHVNGKDWIKPCTPTCKYRPQR